MRECRDFVGTQAQLREDKKWQKFYHSDFITFFFSKTLCKSESETLATFLLKLTRVILLVKFQMIPCVWEYVQTYFES